MSAAEVVAVECGTLATLAAEIRREHAAGKAKARDAVDHARRAGELLLRAKDRVPHGDWLSWLACHVEVTPRQAQRYMRVAEHWPAIAAKYDAESHLSLQSALRLLSPTYDEAWRSIPFCVEHDRQHRALVAELQRLEIELCHAETLPSVVTVLRAVEAAERHAKFLRNELVTFEHAVREVVAKHRAAAEAVEQAAGVSHDGA